MVLDTGVVIGGRYRLGQRLAEGGSGVVYAGTDLRLQVQVAVKVLKPAMLKNPNAISRLRREARVAASLTHPNIVRVLDVITEAELAAVVMELLPGETLGVRVSRDGPLDPMTVATIGEQIASALAAGHVEGIVHRDVKPDNVSVLETPRGVEAKLVDFGIVSAPMSGEDGRLTATNVVIGSWQYMPPEQAHGYSLDGRADVYALGGTLHYALTGKRPYESSGMADASMFALSPVPARSIAELRSDLDEGLVQLIDRALTKDREERPDAATLRDALAAWRTDQAAALESTVERPPAKRATAHDDTLTSFGNPKAPIAEPASVPASTLASFVAETVSSPGAEPPAPVATARARPTAKASPKGTSIGPRRIVLWTWLGVAATCFVAGFVVGRLFF